VFAQNSISGRGDNRRQLGLRLAPWIAPPGAPFSNACFIALPQKRTMPSATRARLAPPSQTRLHSRTKNAAESKRPYRIGTRGCLDGTTAGGFMQGRLEVHGLAVSGCEPFALPAEPIPCPSRSENRPAFIDAVVTEEPGCRSPVPTWKSWSSFVWRRSRAYALLNEAMREAEFAAVAQSAMHRRDPAHWENLPVQARAGAGSGKGTDFRRLHMLRTKADSDDSRGNRERQKTASGAATSEARGA